MTVNAETTRCSFIESDKGWNGEVQLGTWRRTSRRPRVSSFWRNDGYGHTAANDKLKTIAANKGCETSDKPSVAQMATKPKTEVVAATGRF